MAEANRWVVLKFGGTSVSRRNRWDTIGRLAGKRMAEEGVRVLVVVSALSGVTNELQAIANGDGIDARVAALVERHRAFCAELDLDADAVLGERLAALQALATDAARGERTLDWQAEVLAQGELLSSTLGAAYLRTQGHDFGWCDARALARRGVAAQRQRLGAAAVGQLPAAMRDGRPSARASPRSRRRC